MTLEQIQNEISQNLDDDDRHELTWFLYHLNTDQENQQDASAERAWDSAISKRIQEIDDGTVQTIPWEEVRRKMDELSQVS